MKIPTVRLTAHLRTWLLVAGLTALLVAVGAVIGGGFLHAFVALAVLMNLIGYWFSDRIALAARHARPLAEREAPELHRVVGELAACAGVPMPRLYLVASEQPNAFATGRNPGHSAVATHPAMAERVRRLRSYDSPTLAAQAA